VTVLLNNFDGGPSGTDISAANSGQVPGNNAFDGVLKSGTGAVLAYSDAFARPTAEFLMKAQSGNQSGHALVYWTTSMGSQAQTWHRCYFLFSSAPDAALSPTILASEASSGTAVRIGLNPPENTIYVEESFGGTGAESTVVIPIGQWCRLEARVQWGTGSSGSIDCRIYDEADSDIPAETVSMSNVTLNATASVNYYFGYISALANQPPLYLSGAALSNEGWIGPAPFKSKGVPGIQPNPIAIHSDTW
jgi:hypothetical protein